MLIGIGRIDRNRAHASDIARRHLRVGIADGGRTDAAPDAESDWRKRDLGRGVQQSVVRHHPHRVGERHRLAAPALKFERRPIDRLAGLQPASVGFDPAANLAAA